MSGRITMETFREEVIKLAPECMQDRITAPELARRLGVSPGDESQMAVIRKRLHKMTEQGELNKVATGVYVRTGKQSPSREQGPDRMWRAIRSSKETSNSRFTIQEIVSLAEKDASFVHRYVTYLRRTGLVELVGKDKIANVYKLTRAGAEHRQTPVIQKLPDAPYTTEKSAAIALARVMRVGDIASPQVQERIRAYLTVLNATFMQLENEEETHGDNENP